MNVTPKSLADVLAQAALGAAPEQMERIVSRFIEKLASRGLLRSLSAIIAALPATAARREEAVIEASRPLDSRAAAALLRSAGVDPRHCTVTLRILPTAKPEPRVLLREVSLVSVLERAAARLQENTRTKRQ